MTDDHHRGVNPRSTTSLRGTAGHRTHSGYGDESDKSGTGKIGTRTAAAARGTEEDDDSINASEFDERGLS